MPRFFSNRKKLIIILSLLVIFLAALITAASSSTNKQNASSKYSLFAVSPTKKQEVASAGTTPTIASTSQQSIPTVKTSHQIATVVKVVDGDTITVSFNGNSETIRIIGINTPETVDPRKTVECFGKEASAKTKEYMSNSSNTVWLEADPTQGDRDKYQRLLRYIFINNDTTDYGKTMIATGYAYEYTYNTPYKYQLAYKQAQKDAESKKLGLWADNACAGPPVSNQNSNPSTTPQQNTNNSGGDKNCSDFATHVDAQAYFVGKGGSPSNNVDKLDSDGDGIACESLP